MDGGSTVLHINSQQIHVKHDSTWSQVGDGTLVGGFQVFFNINNLCLSSIHF